MNTKDLMFVAEISANHLGSLDRARQIIDAAAKANASAVKLQTYTADTMTLNIPKFSVQDDHPLWGGRRLYDLYLEAYTPWEWHSELFNYARELNLIPFSSPFDLSAVDFLESLDCPIYKVASLETGDLRLIKRIAETGKPIIASTGATTLQEIEELLDAVRSTSSSEITLLVCTSSYPALPKDANLGRIQYLRETFGVNVGISDHSLGIGVAIAGIALGASVVEKHITLSRGDGGADAEFSMEPDEFAEMVRHGNDAHAAIGNSTWEDISAEDSSRTLRRTLYIVKDVQKGDVVTHDNTRAIRPGGGAPPRLLDELLGKKFLQNYSAGEPLLQDKVLSN
ncbi:SpsE Sialic acid synthase [Candidatus Nanopelagicaceae bacterium]